MGYKIMRYTHKVQLVVCCSFLVFLNKLSASPNASDKSDASKVSYIEPIGNIALSIEQRLDLARGYIDENKGQEALDAIKPLLNTAPPTYTALIIAAQSYAVLNDPAMSSEYFNKALLIAKTNDEKSLAEEGIAKMKLWIEQSQLDKNKNISENLSEQDSKSLDLVRKYINEDKGQPALDILKPMLANQPGFNVLILTAQSYAALNKPEVSLDYFQKALLLAKTAEEKAIANSGINKMKLWLKQNKSQPASGTQRPSAQSQRLDLARQYIAADEGLKALNALRPLLTAKPDYDVLILTAQSYAVLNKPRISLEYYQKALAIAKNSVERQIAYFGIGKMQFWIGQYFRARATYEKILLEKPNKGDYELAMAGRVKSMAYADRPMLAFRTIPESLTFTTPEMVIAAGQASLWSDWADITKNIVTQYASIINKIPKDSPLNSDYQDLLWQMNQATWPNVATPMFFYSSDSEGFIVKRGALDYTHYWSQVFQSSVAVEQAIYTQYGAELKGTGVAFGQMWRPTRTLTFRGQIEPTDFDLWSPTLWAASGNYRPNDYFSFGVNGLREVVETFPAFSQHITDDQVNGSIRLNPVPYIQLNGSLNQLDFSDTNVRNGYYFSAMAQLSTEYGVSLTLQERGFTNKFVSPYYFSPNRYSAETVILRLSSKAGSVWHYYIDGGYGSQLVTVNDVPSSSSPTHQWGCGINGPLTDRIILSANYLMTNQASSFIDSPNYSYQAGTISLKFLL